MLGGGCSPAISSPEWPNVTLTMFPARADSQASSCCGLSRDPMSYKSQALVVKALVVTAGVRCYW